MNCQTAAEYLWIYDGGSTRGKTLSLSENMANKTVTLEVSFSGNYRGNLQITIPIGLQNQTAPETPPTLSEKTNTSVTLETIAGMEYTYCIGSVVAPSNDAVWQPHGTFEGLDPNTTYSFFMRKAETATSYASAASGALIVTTDKTMISGTVTVLGGNKVGETLVSDVNVTENAELSYQWYRNDRVISGATSNQYTLTEADAGSNVTLVVSGINSFAGTIQSNAVLVRSNEISPDDPQIAVTNKAAIPSTTIQVPIVLSNNPGFAYLRIVLEYDESVLTLTKVSNSVPRLVMAEGSNVLSWDSSSSYAGNGELCVLTFTVDPEAEIGEYEIKLSVSECYDENTDDVEIYALGGTVSVIDFVYGDANGDGEVNGKDVIVLRRYLVGQDVEIFAGADANGDGEPNGKDVIILRRYLVGTAELGPVA